MRKLFARVRGTSVTLSVLVHAILTVQTEMKLAVTLFAGYEAKETYVLVDRHLSSTAQFKHA